jgi:hypothetical protein
MPPCLCRYIWCHVQTMEYKHMDHKHMEYKHMALLCRWNAVGVAGVVPAACAVRSSSSGEPQDPETVTLTMQDRSSRTSRDSRLGLAFAAPTHSGLRSCREIRSGRAVLKRRRRAGLKRRRRAGSQRTWTRPYTRRLGRCRTSCKATTSPSRRSLGRARTAPCTEV